MGISSQGLCGGFPRTLQSAMRMTQESPTAYLWVLTVTPEASPWGFWALQCSGRCLGHLWRAGSLALVGRSFKARGEVVRKQFLLVPCGYSHMRSGGADHRARSVHAEFSPLAAKPKAPFTHCNQFKRLRAQQYECSYCAWAISRSNRAASNIIQPEHAYKTRKKNTPY
ncbi:hypothetical protein NDU88_000349 [Pleurodeles waltl]|uniref:Uncharacterized protein n=1 Tax=Pleurodeles waltl TaxID=8319 RepID=A0AAV7VVT5_PLEWA|nr:hypothetical protein NDU88_000349 [Pleurodeles waltl]